MYGYVYKITNLIDHKIYIGRHKAKAFDEDYWGSGIYIKRAIAAFGKENFTREVIAWAKSNDELNQLEIKYIAEYKATDPNIGYNLTLGGDAIMAGRVKVIKGTKYKFIPENYISLFLAAGWTRVTKEATNAKWRKTHKAKRKAAKKRHRQRHPEALARNNKTYYAKHKEQLKQYYKEYNKKHPRNEIAKEKNRLAQQKYLSNPANRAKHNALRRERYHKAKEKPAGI